MDPLELAGLLVRTQEDLVWHAAWLNQRFQSELVQIKVCDGPNDFVSLTFSGQVAEAILRLAAASNKQEIRNLLTTYLENDT